MARFAATLASSSSSAFGGNAGFGFAARVGGPDPILLIGFMWKRVITMLPTNTSTPN